MRRVYLESLLAGFCTFVLFLIMRDNGLFTVFQVRDLARAELVAQGNLILWGPESTGGGNLPGGFYYWLMSIPFLFGFDWPGVWLEMALLAGMSVGVMWFFLSRWGTGCAALGLLFMVGSWQILLMFRAFWNPSFLYLFIVFFAAGAVWSYTESRNRSWLWPLSMLCLSLSVQLHLAALPLLLVPLFLQFRPETFSAVRLPWKTWWIGWAALAIPIAPYLVWALARSQGVAIGMMPPESSGELKNALTGVLQNPSNVWNEYNGWLLTLRRPVIGILSMLSYFAWGFLALGLTLHWTKKNFALKFGGPEKILALCAACALISGSFNFILPMGTRYALPFRIYLLMLVAVFCAQWFRPWFQKWPQWWGAAHIAAVTAVAIGLAYVPQEKGDETYRAWLLNSEAEWVANYIYDRTGWDYEKARKKIQLLQMHRETDLSRIFEHTIKDRPKPQPRGEIDGFFVFAGESEAVTPAEARIKIVDMRPPEELAEDIRKNRIELLEVAHFFRASVVPFRWKNPQDRLEIFHNLGFPLHAAEEDKILAEVSVDAVKETSSGILFGWNDCPGQPEYGKSGVVVDVKGDRAQVTVVGRALAQPTPWTFPNCTQGWKETFVNFTCKSGGIKSFSVASSLGLNWIEPPMASETFLAPFSRSYEIGCRGSVSQIEVGRKLVVINDNGVVSMTTDAKPLRFMPRPQELSAF